MAFWNTPGHYTYTVPANVYALKIAARGGDGDDAWAWSTQYQGGGKGGLGATLMQIVTVTPGDVLDIIVGQGGGYRAIDNPSQDDRYGYGSEGGLRRVSITSFLPSKGEGGSGGAVASGNRLAAVAGGGGAASSVGVSNQNEPLVVAGGGGGGASRESISGDFIENIHGGSAVCGGIAATSVRPTNPNSNVIGPHNSYLRAYFPGSGPAALDSPEATLSARGFGGIATGTGVLSGHMGQYESNGLEPALMALGDPWRRKVSRNGVMPGQDIYANFPTSGQSRGFAQDHPNRPTIGPEEVRGRPWSDTYTWSDHWERYDRTGMASNGGSGAHLWGSDHQTSDFRLWVMSGGGGGGYGGGSGGVHQAWGYGYYTASGGAAGGSMTTRSPGFLAGQPFVYDDPTAKKNTSAWVAIVPIQLDGKDPGAYRVVDDNPINRVWPSNTYHVYYRNPGIVTELSDMGVPVAGVRIEIDPRASGGAFDTSKRHHAIGGLAVPSLDRSGQEPKLRASVFNTQAGTHIAGDLSYTGGLDAAVSTEPGESEHPGYGGTFKNNVRLSDALNGTLAEMPAQNFRAMMDVTISQGGSLPPVPYFASYAREITGTPDGNTAHAPVMSPSTPAAGENIRVEAGQEIRFLATSSDIYDRRLSHTGWTLEIQNNTSGAAIPVTPTLVSTEDDLKGGRLNIGVTGLEAYLGVTLRWRVRGRDMQGNQSAPTDWRTFTPRGLIAVDITLPEEDSVHITGLADIMWDLDIASGSTVVQQDLVVYVAPRKDSAALERVVVNETITDPNARSYFGTTSVLPDRKWAYILYIVRDQWGIAGKGQRWFQVRYEAPAPVAYTYDDGSRADELGYLQVNWPLAQPTTGWSAWNVYRRVLPAASWTKVATFTNQDVRTWRDYEVGSVGLYEYCVTQVAVSGGGIEVGESAVGMYRNPNIDLESFVNLFPNPRFAGTGQATLEVFRNLETNPAAVQGGGAWTSLNLVDVQYRTDSGLPEGLPQTYVRGTKNVVTANAGFYRSRPGIYTSVGSGGSLTISVWVRLSQGGSVTPRLEGQRLSPILVGPSFPIEPNVWTEVRHTFTLPTLNETGSEIAVMYAGPDTPIGSTVDQTAATIGADIPYFSGSYTSDPDLTPSWVGTANASASVLKGVPVRIMNQLSGTSLIVSSLNGRPAARQISHGTNMFTQNLAGALQFPEDHTWMATAHFLEDLPFAYNLPYILTTPPNMSADGPSSKKGTYPIRLHSSTEGENSGKRAQIRVRTGRPGLEAYWTDACLVEGTYTGPPFHGHSSIPGWIAEWDGEVDNSPSILTRQIDFIEDRSANVNYNSYWLVDTEVPTRSVRVLGVTGDNPTEEYESATTGVIGRGRHVDTGTRYGYRGTLTVKIRSTDRQSLMRLAIEGIRARRAPVLMRTPHGRTLLVSLGDLGWVPDAGRGNMEMGTLTIPYEEVAY